MKLSLRTLATATFILVAVVAGVRSVLEPNYAQPLTIVDGSNYYRYYAEAQQLLNDPGRQEPFGATARNLHDGSVSPLEALFRPGSIWPKPQLQTSSSNILKLSNSALTFQHKDDNTECALLDEVIRRYEKLILKQQRIFGPDISTDNVDILHNVTIQLEMKCDDAAYPPADMDEHYGIKIDAQFGSYMFAVSQWGLLRAFESFA